MRTLRLILSDKFIWLLTMAVLLALFVPVRGDALPAARWAVSAGIFLIFFLHGVRLDSSEVLAGIRNWRLQGAVFAFVYGAMAAAGWLLWAALDPAIEPGIALGFLYLGCLPSTVQSAASYSAIARGNVAASVVAAAFINLLGIVMTPVLFALLARSVGIVITGETFLRIMTMLLLPFVLGQLTQRWVRAWVLRHGALTGWADKLAISLAVYVAFSGTVVTGALGGVPGDQFAIIAGGIALLLLFGFAGSWGFGTALGFDDANRRSLLFAGAHKSIAIGAPLAALLLPPAQAGLLLIPLILYHVTSLVISAPLAVYLAGE